MNPTAAQIITNDTPFSSTIRSCSRSLSSSFSSNSSFGSLSYRDDPDLFSPTTPLQSSRVPFSWEHLPGIPKQQIPKKKDNSLITLLPLPPAGTSNASKTQEISTIRKKYTSEKDPFFAALVECSKDDDHNTIGNFWKGSSKMTRTLSDRFGFINIYTSCKTTCAVSESIVYLPTSTSTSHVLLNRRRSTQKARSA